MNYKLICFLTAVSLGFLPVAHAQMVNGVIEGTVRDAQGLILPGVSVTLTGEALIGQQVAVTLTDGSYRFRALRPGSYNLLFELAGFEKLNREGIIVEGNRTFTVDIALGLASVAETVTVTGESPIVDTKTTSLSQ